MSTESDSREFLASRRAKITPRRAGLPAYGGNRRVPGLRREEVALLAGVSIDYYVRLQRGHLAGASEEVLDSVANALQLDDAERAHLTTWPAPLPSGPHGAPGAPGAPAARCRTPSCAS